MGYRCLQEEPQQFALLWRKLFYETPPIQAAFLLDLLQNAENSIHLADFSHSLNQILLHRHSQIPPMVM